MSIRDTRTKRAVFEIIFYVVLIGLVISLAVFSGFALGGFNEQFFTNEISVSSYLGAYLIYIPLLIIALLVTVFSIGNLLIIKEGEHPATQSNPSFWRIFSVSLIYNPEDGFLWALSKEFKEQKSIKWTTNIIRVIFISIIVFGIIGIVQVFAPQIAVSGVQQTAQQITPTSDIIFGAGIPSVAENGALLFNLCLLLGITAFLTSKYIRDKKTALWTYFAITLILIPIIMGIIWASYHRIAYGNSEASLIATFIFGWLGTIITILTGIFIFWFFWHFINNLMLKLLDYVTLKEDIIVVAGIFLFFIIIIYAWFEIVQYKKRNKPKSEEQLLVG